MRLSLDVGYWGAQPRDDLPLVQEADRLGYHSVWTSESYGSDAVVPLTWFAANTERIGLGTAVMQMPARTPAMTAMTALTLDWLSGGRVHLGVGMSGPQVVEGWHGVPYRKPLQSTREYIDIVRQVIARERPVSLQGQRYQIPYTGEDSTGLGKPLKSITHPKRPSIPIYLASIGPKNVELTGELADGWLPIFVSPDRFGELFMPHLERGLAKGHRDLSEIDIAACVPVAAGHDLGRCRDEIRPTVALYVGGMGAKGQNFYNDLACRYGYEAAADKIQELYLDGHRSDAIAAVPDELVDEVSLVGPREHIADRLEAWRESGITNFVAMTGSIESVRVLAELLL